jgi:hypothetical protein
MPMSLEAKTKILKIVHDTVDLAAMLMIPEVIQKEQVVDDSSDADLGIKTRVDSNS